MSLFESVCCACLTDFRSHRRLVYHVRRPNRCNAVYCYLDAHRQLPTQIPLVERQALDAIREHADWAHTHAIEASGQLSSGQLCPDGARLRAVKIPGPLLSEAVAVGIRR